MAAYLEDYGEGSVDSIVTLDHTYEGKELDAMVRARQGEL